MMSNSKCLPFSSPFTLKPSLVFQLAEEQEEAEDCRRQMVTAKRKLAKYNEEMEDMKLILETSHIRNAELEKKQRKYVLLASTS